jgi:hypothetical protein
MSRARFARSDPFPYVSQVVAETIPTEWLQDQARE